MPTLTAVSCLDLAQARRFDPQFFAPEVIALESVLDTVRTQRLTAVCRVCDGNHGSISEYFSADPATGPRYLRGQDIGDFFLGDENCVYIPESMYSQLSPSAPVQ